MSFRMFSYFCQLIDADVLCVGSLEAFKRRTTASIVLEEEKIVYFKINNFKVIPVLHSMVDPGYSENYISLIRDLVSGQKNDFKTSILS